MVDSLFVGLFSVSFASLASLVLLLRYHALKSLTDFTFQSYIFNPENHLISDEDSCILKEFEKDELWLKKGRLTPLSSESELQEHEAEQTNTPLVYMSFIVPAYNEEKRIEKMLHNTLTYCLKRFEETKRTDRPFTFEIIVIDDGSKDQTRKVVEGVMDKYNIGNKKFNCLRLLPLVKNQGKGFAVKQGVLRSRGLRILMLDADGATEISDIEKLEAALDKFRHEEITTFEKENKGTDSSVVDSEVSIHPPFNMALGSRRQVESDADRHWLRSLMSITFNLLVKYISGIQSVKDTQCGFKLFERSAARYLFINQHCERWCFDIDILILSQYHKHPTIKACEVPVRWQEIAGSHLTLGGLLGILRDLFLIRLYYETGLWKIRGTNGVKQGEANKLWISGYEEIIHQE